MIETVERVQTTSSNQKKDPKQRPNYVDMTGNTLNSFVVRLGHYQDHQKNTRSLFAQTDIGDNRWWGWHSLEDQNGFRTPEKRPAVQTLCDLFAKLFSSEILDTIDRKEIEGIKVVQDEGFPTPLFDSNLTSREFAEILNELGFDIEYHRSSDKPRITSARIKRK